MRHLFLLSLAPILAWGEIGCVADIDKAFAQIQNSLQSYQASWKHTSSPSAHIKKVSYRDPKGTIRLIEVTMTNPNERRIDRYYFSKQQLFLASKLQYRQQKLTSTQKLYFIGDKMVQWIEEKELMDTTSNSFKAKAKETLEFAQFLLKDLP